MRGSWEFLEKFDEFVYVTDLETNQIVYMNEKLRNTLNIKKDTEYEGQLCYKVLQGREDVCDFCTNDKLEEGKFYSWITRNPLFQKQYFLKDTIVIENGKRYRMEVAIDIDPTTLEKQNCHYYVRTETLLNECLQRMSSVTNPEDALQELLRYIGETFGCDRAYIFEQKPNNTIDNTFEWCAPHAIPQKDILQNEPLEAVSWWIELFEKNDILVIENIEDIRKQYPLTYAILQPQNITSLVVGSIHTKEKIVGFFGVDNPKTELLHLLKALLSVLGYFIAISLKRRDLSKRLHDLSFIDHLTGAWNRNALTDLYGAGVSCTSMGMIYCDVSGLKKVNDTYGHAAGDRMIIESCNLIRQSLEVKNIYRIGGDEFLAVFLDCDLQTIQQKTEKLKLNISRSTHHIAVGYAWSDKQPIQAEWLMKQADEKMYEDKQLYYRHCRLWKPTGYSSNTKSNDTTESKKQSHKISTTSFYDFLSENYYDIETIYRSWTLVDKSRYAYFGDMQTGKFYISNNMRDLFGFTSNVVTDLFCAWETRIATPEHKELYRKYWSQIMKEKRTTHDLQYKVKDIYGQVRWVRSCGILKWSEDGQPIFFSGSISAPDTTFIIDHVTNFPREQSAIEKIEEFHTKNEHIAIISFRLNQFGKINDTRGRHAGNLLLRRICEQLVQTFDFCVSFYRLEGMCFLGIVKPEHITQCELYIEIIRQTIVQEYRKIGISVPHPCSFVLLDSNDELGTPEELLEHAILLLGIAREHPEQKFVRYTPTSVSHSRNVASMMLTLSDNVLHNMKNFRIVIQPIVDAKTKKIIGGETLLRWQFEGKEISPSIFIPIMEKEKTICMAGKWVFEQTVRACKRMVSHNPDFYLTFNVSYCQIIDDDFLTFMKQTLQKYRLNGRHLVAELTETHFDEQPKRLQHFVNECQDMGMKIALDDFGSGYSSLSLLLRYPASIIKLDRSLLLEMTKSEDKTNFIYSIVYACHRFGKEVCVEGVETQEHVEIMSSSECDMIQGFYYHKPMEVKDIYTLICEK